MEVRVPVSRKSFFSLLSAAFSALIGRTTELSFNCKEVNGLKRPTLLSKDSLAELQQSHLEAVARATALQELVEDALEKMPPDDLVARHLRAGLEHLERRVLH